MNEINNLESSSSLLKTLLFEGIEIDNKKWEVGISLKSRDFLYAFRSGHTYWDHRELLNVPVYDWVKEPPELKTDLEIQELNNLVDILIGLNNAIIQLGNNEIISLTIDDKKGFGKNNVKLVIKFMEKSDNELISRDIEEKLTYDQKIKVVDAIMQAINWINTEFIIPETISFIDKIKWIVMSHIPVMPTLKWKNAK